MRVAELRRLLDGVDDDLEVTIRGGEVEFRRKARAKPSPLVQCDTCHSTDSTGSFAPGQVAGHTMNGAQCPGTWRRQPTPASGGKERA